MLFPVGTGTPVRFGAFFFSGIWSCNLSLIHIFYTKVAPNTYIFDGKTHLNDLLKVLELDDGYLDNFRGDAETVAGLMLEIRRDFLRQGEVLYCRKPVSYTHLGDDRAAFRPGLCGKFGRLVEKGRKKSVRKLFVFG